MSRALLIPSCWTLTILLPQPPEWRGLQASATMADSRMPILAKESGRLGGGEPHRERRGEAGRRAKSKGETRRCEQAQSRAPGPAQAPRGARTHVSAHLEAEPGPRARPRPLPPKPPPLPFPLRRPRAQVREAAPAGDPADAGPPWSTSARPRLVAWAEEEGEQEGC